MFVGICLPKKKAMPYTLLELKEAGFHVIEWEGRGALAVRRLASTAIMLN